MSDSAVNLTVSLAFWVLADPVSEAPTRPGQADGSVYITILH